MLFESDGRFIVGLTGMSGAGKSTACGIFDKHGFCVIDCDAVSREVVLPDAPALADIRNCFGEEIICEDGTLNRKKLAGIVFSDALQLKKLDEIIYPFITYNIIEKLAAKKSPSMILLDAPTLFESGADMLCDCIVSVTADIDICRERIMRRDSLTEEQAGKRLSSQFGPSFYEQRSDFTIRNNGDTKSFAENTEKVIIKIINEGK